MSELEDKIKKIPDIKMEYRHLGLKEDGGHYEDQWSVTLLHKNCSYTTEYFTGIGNRTLKPKVIVKPGNIYYFDGQNKTLIKAVECGWLKLGKPSLADVLHSLLVDATTGKEMFEDWCNEFGYDTDSRKALNIYLACQKTRGELIRMFGHALLNELIQLDH